MKPKPYTPLDLGYTRTPTSAKLRVRFSNGDTFDVPLQVVADDRDKHYQNHKEDTVGKKDGWLAVDWAENNMNWSELEPYAVKVDTPPVLFDYSEAWSEADLFVEGEV